MTEKTPDTDTDIPATVQRYNYTRCRSRDIDMPNATYSPSLGNLESYILIKTIYIGLLNYVKQNGYLKIFTELVWRYGVCRERGYLPSNL